jgi:hypothetical protein
LRFAILAINEIPFGDIAVLRDGDIFDGARLFSARSVV